MKRLLSLIMLFALVSMANAVYFFSVDGVNPSDGTEDIEDGGGSVTVYIIEDTGTTAYMYYLEMLKPAGGGKATMTDPVDETGTPPIIIDPPEPPDPTVYSYELLAQNPFQTGVHFTTVLTEAGDVSDTFFIDLIDYGVGTIDSITFTIVPEPMCIALLGLGALMLRKRKQAEEC